VPPALAGSRLDVVAALLSGLSRRAVADAVATGAVRLDGRPVRTRSQLVRAGQHLRMELPPTAEPGPAPDASVPVAVVHEDAELVVVDKPAGLVVHHGAGHRRGTLVDGLLARFPDLAALAAAGVGDPGRPGIVHRLDKGTSGLLVVARTAHAQRSLSAQLRERTAGRGYVALVAGTMQDDDGVVDAPIGRSTRRRTQMAVRAQGKPARTGYHVEARFTTPVPCTLVSATLDSGRTHQVRVHLAAIGHPVIGDDRYGGPAARPESLVRGLGPGRLFLHAARLSLLHPDGSGAATWTSPLPPDLQRVLDGLS